MEHRLLLRPTEAATALGISRARVYELMTAGALSSVKIGASRRVPVEALHDLVRRLEEGAAVDTPRPDRARGDGGHVAGD